MAKRILDEETRKQLLGYVPFSVDAKITFTPDEFSSVKDETLRPVFELRSLNQAELTQLKKSSMGMSREASPEEVNRIAEANTMLIRACVLGWKNLFDSGLGEEIEYSSSPTGGCEESLFKRLPIWIVRSIMEFVKKISGLSVAEELSLK
jgi:hypothetical protein